jgi:hypothetical protein
MAYADAVDINKHLDQTKLSTTTVGSFAAEGDSADRIIRAKLSGMVDAATFATWTTPTATPEIIREISGMLVAAQLYGRLYSEDVAETSSYAQLLYDRAMELLNGIVSGEVDIVGVVGVEASGSLTATSFYPTNNVDDPGEERKFGMARIF